ncbi:unnamed protein product [Pieris brassicae]|uniref:LITAF domain-containing protein n=1 Tax=Pieris brassicae TaxID=7116 RepID=A0A9P0X7X8_PIEBR|nr:unnamed protein product [Pieris brassicae]
MDKQHLYDGRDDTEDITMTTNQLQLVETKASYTAVLLGPETSTITCPHCGSTVKTRVRYTTTARTHIAAALCGFICCCCCIPYCSSSAKNTDHFCPNCLKYLGTYEK